MNIDCLIIEDDPAEREFLVSLAQKIPQLGLIRSCSGAAEASGILATEHIDLIISDIEMGELSGIDFVRSLIKPPPVIFTTSFPGYAVDGFEVNAIDYVVKPVTLGRLMKAVNKAHEKIKQDKTDRNPAPGKDHFFIRTEAQYVKLKYDDVIYIEAYGDFVKIYTPVACTLALVNLKNIEDQLPAEIFMRVHRSFLVNITKIDNIDTSHIKALSYTIPISKAFRDKLHTSVVEVKLVKRFSDESQRSNAEG